MKRLVSRALSYRVAKYIHACGEREREKERQTQKLFYGIMNITLGYTTYLYNSVNLRPWNMMDALKNTRSFI